VVTLAVYGDVGEDFADDTRELEAVPREARDDHDLRILGVRDELLTI
jgi:hypothetical protein